VAANALAAPDWMLGNAAVMGRDINIYAAAHHIEIATSGGHNQVSAVHQRAAPMLGLLSPVADIAPHTLWSDENCDKNWLVLKYISLGSSGFVELSTYVCSVVWMIIIQITFCLYCGETYMTNVGSNASPATARDTKQIVLKEIRAKWGKFSEQDLSALKSNSDLVTQPRKGSGSA
jgi:hypothetical protein